MRPSMRVQAVVVALAAALASAAAADVCYSKARLGYGAPTPLSGPTDRVYTDLFQAQQDCSAAAATCTAVMFDPARNVYFARSGAVTQDPAYASLSAFTVVSCSFIQDYAVPAGVDSWWDSRDFCNDPARGLSLCSFDQVCTGGHPFFPVLSGSMWTAVHDDSHTWVQIGDNGTASDPQTCFADHFYRPPTGSAIGRIICCAPPLPPVTFGPDRPTSLSFVGNDITWGSAETSCEDRGQLLCRKERLCGSADSPSLSFRPLSGNYWVPVKDDFNAWVQIGSSSAPNASATCQSYADKYGYPAPWGEDAAPYYAKGFVMCCAATADELAYLEESELIANGNFDMGTGNPYERGSRGQFAVVPVTGVPNGASYAIELRGDGDNIGEYEVHGIPDEFPLCPGLYRISAYVQVGGLTPDDAVFNSLHARFFDKDNKPITSVVGPNPGTKRTFEFVSTTVQLLQPAYDFAWYIGYPMRGFTRGALRATGLSVRRVGPCSSICSDQAASIKPNNPGSLQSLKQGLCARPEGGSTDENTPVTLGSLCDSPDAQFVFTTDGSLKQFSTTRCLGVVTLPTVPGTSVVLSTAACKTQTFSFNSFNSLQHSPSGLCLVPGRGNSIQLSDSCDGDATLSSDPNAWRLNVAYSQDNLVQNGDFSQPGGLPGHRFDRSSSITVGTLPSSPPGLTTTLGIVSGPANGSVVSYDIFPVPQLRPLCPGAYRVSAWVLTTPDYDGVANAFMYSFYDSRGNDFVPPQAMNVTFTPTPGTWQQVQLTLTLPDYSQFFHLRMGFPGMSMTGSMYITGIELTKVTLLPTSAASIIAAVSDDADIVPARAGTPLWRSDVSSAEGVVARFARFPNNIITPDMVYVQPDRFVTFPPSAGGVSSPGVTLELTENADLIMCCRAEPDGAGPCLNNVPIQAPGTASWFPIGPSTGYEVTGIPAGSQTCRFFRSYAAAGTVTAQCSSCWGTGVFVQRGIPVRAMPFRLGPQYTRTATLETRSQALDELLTGALYTMFAPLATGFDDTMFAVLQEPDNALMLSYYMKNLLIPGRVYLKDMVPGTRVTTLAGGQLSITDGASGQLFLNGMASFVDPDIYCSDGMVQGISNMLIPEEVLDYTAGLHTMTIDGSLDEWRGIPNCIIGTFESSVTGLQVPYEVRSGSPPASASDHFSLPAVAWDENFVYLKVEVVDDQHQNTGTDVLQLGDSIRVLCGTAGRFRTHVVALYPDGSVQINSNFLTAGNVAVTRNETTLRTVYELRMNPASCNYDGAQFKAGMLMRVAVRVMDGDLTAGEAGAGGFDGWGARAVATSTVLMRYAGKVTLAGCDEGNYQTGVGPDGASVCETVTVCTGDQYETKPPTPTSDRQCAPLTPVCGSGQWEAVTPTATSNRVCQTCTACPATHFALANCTATSDTVCQGCGACAAGQYEVMPCGAGSDRQCAPCRSCKAGEFVAGGCTGSTNTICTPWTSCLGVGIEYEAVAGTPTSNRVCMAVGVCDSQSYETAAPTATSDRTCRPLTVCKPGAEYEAVPPTDTSDRVCASVKTGCGVNEWQKQASTATSDRVCAPLTTCGAGQQQTVAPTLTSDRSCGPCPAGTFSEVGDIACKPCTTKCGPGTYLVPCSSTVGAAADASCEPCPPATFKAGTNTAQSCTAATTNCGDGQYIFAAAQPDRDTLCQACTRCNATTQFSVQPCDGINNALCFNQLQCAESQFVNNPKTPSQQCLNCHPSCLRCKGPDSTDCTACVPPLSLTGGTCTDATCTTKQYVDADGVCQPCAADCATCFGGASNQCSSCPAGKQLSGFECVSSCAAGTYAEPTLTPPRCVPCTPCVFGTFEVGPCGGTQDRRCTPLTQCLANQYEAVAPTSTSDRKCMTCTPCTQVGFRSTPCTATANAACVACNGVTEYQDQAGQSFCKLVDPPCPTGTRQIVPPSATSNRKCDDCPDKTYQDEVGMSSCKAATTCAPNAVTIRQASAVADSICGYMLSLFFKAAYTSVFGTTAQTDDFSGQMLAALGLAAGDVENIDFRKVTEDVSVAVLVLNNQAKFKSSYGQVAADKVLVGGMTAYSTQELAENGGKSSKSTGGSGSKDTTAIVIAAVVAVAVIIVVIVVVVGVVKSKRAAAASLDQPSFRYVGGGAGAGDGDDEGGVIGQGRGGNAFTNPMYESAERDDSVRGNNNPAFHTADFGDEGAYAELPIGTSVNGDEERGYMTVSS